VQLANAIAPLFGTAELEPEAFQEAVAPLQASIDSFSDRFGDGWNDMMAARLGFAQFEGEADNDLFGELGRVLQLVETDMTIFHRRLSDVDAATATEADDAALTAPIADAWYVEPNDDQRGQMATWLRAWAARVLADERASGEAATDRIAQMHQVNPKYVLRNWMAQLAIDRSESGDHGGVHELLELLRRPYDEQPDAEDTYFVKRPEWARERAGCSMLSCSS